MVSRLLETMQFVLQDQRWSLRAELGITSPFFLPFLLLLLFWQCTYGMGQCWLRIIQIIFIHALRLKTWRSQNNIDYLCRFRPKILQWKLHKDELVLRLRLFLVQAQYWSRTNDRVWRSKNMSMKQVGYCPFCHKYIQILGKISFEPKHPLLLHIHIHLIVRYHQAVSKFGYNIKY